MKLWVMIWKMMTEVGGLKSEVGGRKSEVGLDFRPGG